ncbi:hypothetical protein ACFO1B_16160 [Dactylosporangium siamense]|uniref:Uncharacterized protein n=1 Tax=Dactylosporangium siamense TaxID=685454 RepID=A0A919PIA9_9ACTN|nr:hypothetical protein [Dactylosporangium siamense]GIG45375.1 hypothetical protein Dsi01nite_034160 [Dactylosporangium siamense]
MADLAQLLEDLRPSELALRDWVRTRLNASIVREMATYDYGMRVDEHRCGIEDLMVARRLPEQVPWPPAEVLELTTYTRIPDGEVTPGSASWRGHVARLFAALLLVRSMNNADPAPTLAGLVASALALGPEATAAAVRYLAWCRKHEPGFWHGDEEARPFLTLGLWLLYGASPDHDPAAESTLRRAFTSELPPPPATPKSIAGAEGRRAWRSLVNEHLPTDEDRDVRAWFA